MRIETDINGNVLDRSVSVNLPKSLNAAYEYLLSYYANLQSISQLNDNIYLPTMWYLGYSIRNNIRCSYEYSYAIDIDFNNHTQYYTQLQSRAYDAFVTHGADHVLWKPSRFDNDTNLFFLTSCF